MANDSLLEQDSFWQILKSLMSNSSLREMSQMRKELNLSQMELNSYLNFLSEVGVEVYIEFDQKGNKKVSISESSKQIELRFTLLEWLAFQAHFPNLSSCDKSPYHDEVKSVLLGAEFKYQNHDLFSPLVTLENVLLEQRPSLLEQLQVNSKEIISFIEESILDKKLIQLQTASDASLEIYPRKIVFLEGELNLIGESVNDKCLMKIPIPRVQTVIELDEDREAEYSSIEVDDFVSSLRAMSDNQVRLVLKINSTQKFNDHFNTMFLERPCLFTNPQGDYIWAATLEPSKDIYEWLCDLGSHVEILDPNTFKLDFIKYCEDKLKKIA